MATNILTQARLKELLHYNSATGIFTWRQSRGTRRKNAIAGSRHPKGYINISIDSKLHRAHRLVWLYEYGCFPDGEIDHINRVPFDNRRNNIQVVTRCQNTQNTGLQRNNISGHRGVGWNMQQQKWRARISIDGKTFYLGRFDTFEDAVSAYTAAASKHHAYRLQSECKSQSTPQ
jgi:hypothetical protein